MLDRPIEPIRSEIHLTMDYKYGRTEDTDRCRIGRELNQFVGNFLTLSETPKLLCGNIQLLHK